MAPELVTMIERIASLCDRPVATAPGTPARLAEIEDVLADGYVQALRGDAWSTRTEQRLQVLVTDGDIPMRGQELRRLARDHASFQCELIALRRALADLRRERDRLRARSSVAST